MKSSGCGKQTLTVNWNTYSDAAVKEVYSRQPVADSTEAKPKPPPPPPPFTPIPASALTPAQSKPEVQRRALYQKLQSGWGTFFHPSMLTWVLLPESFAVSVSLFRLSTGAFLGNNCAVGQAACPVVALTINPGSMHQYAIRPGKEPSAEPIAHICVRAGSGATLGTALSRTHPHSPRLASPRLAPPPRPTLALNTAHRGQP